MAQSLEKAASKNVANTALGLSIGALGWNVLRDGGLGLFGRGLWGGCGDGYGKGYGYNKPYGVGYGHGYDGYGYGYDHCGCGCGCPTPFEVYQKECHDVMALTCKDYDGVILGLNNRFQDRQYTDCGFFNLEKQILCDKLAAQEKDSCLQKEIDGLKGHIAVLEATRPYQDKIIQMEICNARKDAACDLRWETRNAIKGELVLPNSPTVTGFPSYGCCAPTPVLAGE